MTDTPTTAVPTAPPDAEADAKAEAKEARTETVVDHGPTDDTIATTVATAQTTTTSRNSAVTTMQNDGPSRDVANAAAAETTATVMNGSLPTEAIINDNNGGTSTEVPQGMDTTGDGEAPKVTTTAATDYNIDSTNEAVTAPVVPPPADMAAEAETITASQEDVMEEKVESSTTTATTATAETTNNIATTASTDNSNQPPHLGRNASVGDTQPALVERQVSVGVTESTKVVAGVAYAETVDVAQTGATDATDEAAKSGTLPAGNVVNAEVGLIADKDSSTESIPPEVSSSGNSETVPQTQEPIESVAADVDAAADVETKAEEQSAQPPPSVSEQKQEDSVVPMDVDPSPSVEATTTPAATTMTTTSITASKEEVSSAAVDVPLVAATASVAAPVNGDKATDMDVDEEEKEIATGPPSASEVNQPMPMETELTVSAGGAKDNSPPESSVSGKSPSTTEQTAKGQPETAPAPSGRVQPTMNHQYTGRDPPPPAAMSSKTSPAPEPAPAEGPTNQFVDAVPAAGVPPPQVGVAPPAGGMLGGGLKELRVEDALIYLDDVKREFGDRPRVYNEFLAIMKNFKSQEVDTPGVIQRVSRLFRGYNNLILGFNKFLPEGYKITMTDLEQMDAAYAQEQDILRQQQLAMASKQHQPVGGAIGGTIPHQHHVHSQDVSMGGAQPPPPQIVGVPTHHGNAGALGPPPQQQQQQQTPSQPGLMQSGIQRQPPPQKQLSASKKKAAAPKGAVGPAIAPPGPSPQQPPQPQQMHQAVEFDHAISYVTTIKRRFANDPSTYHSFLEILHTYQKEQRGIKEVLEQVAHLFQDHPDLLKEFTFFLPDAVQEQAKERLHRAAADSEARLAAKHAAAQQGPEVAAIAGQQRVVDVGGQPIADVLQGRKRKDIESGGGPTPIAFPQHPDQYMYNSAVERQFFDAAKEALATYTRDGGQAWAEFLKCLDMYAQEILSRSEMLTFVEPLLGRRNNKLFEEFKRILQYAGGQGTNFAPSLIEDAWYSVPLSEIDFSRCRKCSPSYRKLPRDYPAPPCSQRSDEEAKVLNDEWVSLPVGSEESYTFRHMRRNTFEETLFRVEDERFEIDMTIDSNLCTLALLEPFAEEMAQLSQYELQVDDDKDATGKSSRELQGLGGNFFRYTFDKSILGVIHRNSITRIYGDAGKEMLDLMESNPTVAIPIVVKRLQQKDVEWRRVRDRLNRHWKELAEHNYYKSLDHRSLTWRTTDKRALSTRTLIAEIKDRAANNGNEGQQAFQARMDKAKEEHGTFYEVTMASAFSRKLDLSELPKPDRRLFTPHMALMYDTNSHVQRDAYRILSFALERGSISPADKERCHRLWTEFLGPWFHLNLNWMLSPAVTFQETSVASQNKGVTRAVSNNQGGSDDDDSMDEDREGRGQIINMMDDPENGNTSPCQMDHHPLPAGSAVSTVYGEGRIIGCRKEDNVYIVRLPFGTAFLRPSAVLCSIVAAEKSAYTTQRMVDDRTKLDRDDDMLAIGTQSLYLFFRLHQIMCGRLVVARKLAYEVKNDSSLITLVEQIPGDDVACLGRRRYDAFMGLVFALLDGGTGTTAAEGGKFEDRVRSLLGHGGYELATMDKLIGHIVKNIQSMANDDTMWSLVQLFRRHREAGGFKPEAFRQEAAFLSDGEPMYAFQSCPVRKDGGDKSVLYMEYLGVISGSDTDTGSVSDKASGSDAPPPPKRQKRGG
jgi:paired amphipathic helix protein Sin3a